jgi:hypothetical protein
MGCENMQYALATQNPSKQIQNYTAQYTDVTFIH